jgi:predicted nucleic acid-binding protein
LLDLSAWARSSQANVRWTELVERDELLCHPVFAVELLPSAINAQDYHRMRQELAEAFDWVWPDIETARVALGLQAQLASSGPAPHRVKTPDLLIAALAAQHGVGVLHYGGDYDVVRDHGGRKFESEWLAPRGTLGGPAESALTARKAYRKAFGERMAQLQADADLEVWPEVVAWMDEQLLARGLAVPPAPTVP